MGLLYSYHGAEVRFEWKEVNNEQISLIFTIFEKLNKIPSLFVGNGLVHLLFVFMYSYFDYFRENQSPVQRMSLDSYRSGPVIEPRMSLDSYRSGPVMEPHMSLDDYNGGPIIEVAYF